MSEHDEPIDLDDRLCPGHLGDDTIARWLELGLIGPREVADADLSGHEQNWNPYPLTALGRCSIKVEYNEDLDALDSLATFANRSRRNDYAPSASEFSGLAELVRRLWLEVIELRGKVAKAEQTPCGGDKYHGQPPAHPRITRTTMTEHAYFATPTRK